MKSPKLMIKKNILKLLQFLKLNKSIVANREKNMFDIKENPVFDL
jgi:hypothetical protein